MTCFTTASGSGPTAGSLRLSDAFEHPVEPKAYEWTAKVININQGGNEKLQSRPFLTGKR